MGRLMALDFGTKRTGIAVSDNLHLIANGLTTVRTHLYLEFLEEYLKKEVIDKLIIGKPKTLNNEDSESVKHLLPFVKRIELKYPDLPIIFVDERFTSVLAQKAILESGVSKKKRQDKALVDEISATIILQDYMESVRLQDNRNNI